MEGINKVVLIGHVGKNPSIKYLSNGISVAGFPLATSETVVVSGQKTEVTEWHNIVMWRNLAEAAMRDLTKGRLIYIEGKLRTRTFEDKNGTQRSITEILAESYTILGRTGSLSPADNQTRQNPKAV
jgi:single-strand DNA-binding protein